MRILEFLQAKARVIIRKSDKAALLESADALDAVVCAFAGKAIVDACIQNLPESKAQLEGWIAVHQPFN